MTNVNKKMDNETKIKNQNNPSIMNQLMTQSPPLPKPSQIVKGKVIEIGKNTVFVDLGPIGTGVILGREIKENQEIIKNLKPGEEIIAMVLESENEDGFIELSLRAANRQTAWEQLKELMEKKEPIAAKITQANKGGLMVEIKGISGFLPVSQLSFKHYPRVENGDKTKILVELNKFVNKELIVRIIDLDPTQQKLIVSEKALDEQKIKEALKDFKIGDLVQGEISGVVDFGAFVKINLPQSKDLSQTETSETSEKTTNITGQDEIPTAKPDSIEGLIHISEIDWQLIEDPRQFLKTGQKIEAKIIGIEGGGRLSLSLKALKKDPWTEIDQKYQKGQIVKGRVTKLNPFGAFVQLDDEIHGLAHVSDFGSVETMRNTLEIGQEYDFKIISIEPKNHKMALTLVRPEKMPEQKQEQKKTNTQNEKTEEAQSTAATPPSEIA